MNLRSDPGGNRAGSVTMRQMSPQRRAETRWPHPTASLSTQARVPPGPQLSLPSSEEHCPCWGAPLGIILPWGPVCSLPVSRSLQSSLPVSLQLCLAAALLSPLERSHLIRRFAVHREMTCLSAGLFLIRRTCAPTPTVLFLSTSVLRPCTRFLSTHHWAAQTRQSYLRILPRGPSFLKHADVTRSSSALPSLHTGP